MSRIYAKVSVEMWGDQKFGELSKLQPSGQALWLYLLTGKFRTSIPGLNVDVGLGALSDRLKWDVADVKKCWEEIAEREMAFADWDAGVVWLPKGIEHNAPENPNVIKGWGKVVVPECELSRKAWRGIERWVNANLSEPFQKAFRETFRQGSRKQEQEQEQEQEQDSPPQPPADARGRKRAPKSTALRVTAKHQREADLIWKRTMGVCAHKPRCTNSNACFDRLLKSIVGRKR